MSLARCISFSLALSACGAESTAPRSPAPAAVMMGRWDYARPATSGDRPSLNPGLQVTLAIDFVDNADFRGRVERWFSGDVGISANAFGPVVGKMVAGDQVVLTIPLLRADVMALRIVGTVAGDVLTVSESWVGEEPGPFPVAAQFVRLP